MLIKKVFKHFNIWIIFTAFILLSTGKVFAHAIDTSELYFYYKADLDNTPIPEDTARIYVYINWFQANAIVLKATGKSSKDYEELLQYIDIYRDYMLKHLTVSNVGEKCEPKHLNTPIADSPFLLDVGPRQVFDFKCSKNLADVKITNTLLLEEYEFETNFISLSIGDNPPERIEMNRYFTEMNLRITADKIEAEKPEGFVSTNGTLSPDDPNYANQKFSNVNANQLSSESLFAKTAQRLKEFWSGGIKLISPKNVGTFENKPLLSIIGIVFMLGFLHTLEAGHSKVVLTSAMIHKNMSIKRGIAYATVFTVTHIGDILILGLLFLFFNNFVDIYAQFSLLEKVAAYSLFFIALYMLFKNISDYRDSKEHDHEHSYESHSHELDDSQSFRQQLLVGFLSGLAPCVFGWSIFMIVLSTKNAWALFPVIISFGFGIFASLLLVVFSAGLLKKGTYGKFKVVMEFSPIISALVLLLYASYLIF